MNKLLTISPSPHIHTSDSVNKIMYRVILALMPALVWSVVMFGLEAVRVTLIAVAACVSVEFLIQKYILKTTPKIIDGSAVITGVLLAFNVPASLPWWQCYYRGSCCHRGLEKCRSEDWGITPSIRHW